MNLHEELKAFVVGFFPRVDGFEPGVDDDGRGGLADPRDSFVEDRTFDAVEEFAPITEGIMDGAGGPHLARDLVVPLTDFRTFLEIPVLHAHAIVDRETNAPGYVIGFAEIVCAVAKGFELSIEWFVFLAEVRVVVELLAHFEVRFQAGFEAVF